MYVRTHICYGMFLPFIEHRVIAWCHGIFTKSHPKIMAHEEEPLQRWKWFGMVGASKEKSKRYQPQLEVLHFGMAKKCEAKTFQLGSKCWKWENVIKTLLSKASPLWYFFIFGSDEIFDLLWHKCKYFDNIFYSSALCLVYKHWTFCYGFCQCLMVILFSKNLQFGNSIRFNPMMQNIRCQTWCFSEGDLNF